jgi:hypothetical protein
MRSRLAELLLQWPLESIDRLAARPLCEPALTAATVSRGVKSARGRLVVFRARAQDDASAAPPVGRLA